MKLSGTSFPKTLRVLAWIGAVVAAAAALRLFHLGTQSLWCDEAGGLRFARYPIGDLLHEMRVHHEVHPPLYYTFLHYWTNLGGQSERWIRLPSVIGGTLTVGLVFWLAEECGADFQSSIAASTGLACSAFAISQSQEVKDYIFAICAGVIGTALFARLVRKPGTRLAILYGTISVIGFFLHYLVALIWPAQLLSALTCRRPRDASKTTSEFWRAWGIAAAIVFGGLALWAAVFLYQATAQDFSLFRATQWADLYRVPLTLLCGATWSIPANIMHWPVIIIVLGAALLAIHAGYRSLEPLYGRLLLLTVFLPGVILFSMSKITSSHVFWAKYVSFSAPALFLLIGCGLVHMRSRPLAVLVAAILLGTNTVATYNRYWNALYQNQDWRSTGYYLQAHARANDLVLVVPSMMIPPLTYYYHGAAPVVGADITPRYLAPRLARARRIWLCEPPNHPLAQRAKVPEYLLRHAHFITGLQTQSVVADHVLLVEEFSHYQAQAPQATPPPTKGKSSRGGG